MPMTSNNWVSNKSLQAIISAAILGASVLIGINILPLPNESAPSVWYAIHGSTGIAPGIGPIFILDNNLFPHQCGKGRLDEDGTLALTAYSDVDCRAGIANLRPHLLPSDIRIPWALVPDSTRSQLRKLSVASLEHVQTVALRLFHAPFFAQDYLPEIQDILSTALQKIWSAPAIHQTLLHAMGAIDKDRGSALLKGLLPIIAEHARQHLWRTVRVSISAMLGNNSQAQQDAVEQLVAEVIADPRVGEHLSNTLPPLLSSPGTIAIGTSVVREAINALLTDPRLQDLALHLFTDRRFLRLRPIGTDAEQLFMILPTSLLRMRNSYDHNPLVSYILRALIRSSRPSFLILLLNPEQERQLADRNLPPEPNLGRISESGG